MSDSAVIVGLVCVTSLLAFAAARRSGIRPGRALRRALVRLLECVGLAAGFYALNLAVGVVGVLVLRGVTREFMSVYVIGDGTLAILSALQAIVWQWWRVESGRDEDVDRAGG